MRWCARSNLPVKRRVVKSDWCKFVPDDEGCEAGMELNYSSEVFYSYISFIFEDTLSEYKIGFWGIWTKYEV